jgi:hypothetical protein
MMNAFSALLEARDPALGRFRSYRLEVGTDLLSAWLVEVTYGRIVASGRRLRRVVNDEEDARQLVPETLRRRASAKKRIGVSYSFRELVDPWEWVPLTVQ